MSWKVSLIILLNWQNCQLRNIFFEMDNLLHCGIDLLLGLNVFKSLHRWICYKNGDLINRIICSCNTKLRKWEWKSTEAWFVFVPPALAEKTHRDRFVPYCCCCCLLLWKQVNIWLYLPHALMDSNKSWVIDATWKLSYVDEVRGHLSRSNFIWGQVVR